MRDEQWSGRGVDGGPDPGAAERDPRSIRERDLDNFMLEELQASTSFRTWFLSHLSHCFEAPPGHDVRAGKNPKREIENGQTDLSLAFIDADGEQAALVLIENKVASGYQLGQPERYAAERAAARARLGFRRAAAVVVAPASNQTVLAEASFDARIRLEDIVDHLRGRANGELARASDPASVELRERLLARIGLLEALAGKRAYGSWSPNPVPERLGFIEKYRQLAMKLAPHLTPGKKNSGSKGGTSILFSGVSIPGLPIGKIRHDFKATPCVSIEFKRSGAAEAALRKSGLLLPGATMDVTSAGTLMVRLPTRGLVVDDARFEEQQGAIEEAVGKALALENWARENAAALLEIIGQSAACPRTEPTNPQ
jgi:hypothetical protein